jgi:hypothetical protein
MKGNGHDLNLIYSKCLHTRDVFLVIFVPKYLNFAIFTEDLLAIFMRHIFRGFISYIYAPYFQRIH